MDDSDREQALQALRAWFMSQDISPADAGIIMTTLIASLFVQRTKDLAKLRLAICEQTRFLALEVVGELRK